MIGAQLNDTGCTLSPDGEQLVSAITQPGESRIHALKSLLASVELTDRPISLAVSACETRDVLGDWLTQCHAEQLPVAAFLDAAALAAAASGMQGVGVVLSLQKHRAIATRVVASSGRYRVAATQTHLACGWGDLRRACLQQIADTMIRQTRFDPLHEANDERLLEQQLPEWLQRAQAEGTARIGLTALGKPLEVTLSAEDFVKATESIVRQLRMMIRDLRLPGAESYVLVEQAMLDFPGVPAMLADFGSLPVWCVPDGFSTRAAARVEALAFKENEVMLHREVTVPKLIEARRLTLRGPEQYQKPSHVLYDNRIWALNSPISVGRATDNAIVLPPGLAAASRRHCSVQVEADECVVIDHSRYGTWLNEEPVRGRQRLAAGDRLRIGDPGIELKAITVSDDHGQASR